MKRLLKIAKVYCESCWIPAVVHVASFYGLGSILYYSNETLKVVPDVLRQAILCMIFPIIVATFVMMLVSMIVNICKRRWWWGVLACLFCIAGSVPIVMFLLVAMMFSKWDG